MAEEDDGSKPKAALVRPEVYWRRYKVSARVLTMELAEAFAKALSEDPMHTVESAALAAGLRPGLIRKALHRYYHDQCKNLRDEEICEVLYRARTAHIKAIREAGYQCAGRGNRAGTAWVQWQLEVQAPLEHPRRQEASIELTGKDGGPIQTENAVRYVVAVPKEEPDEELEEEPAP